MGLKTTAHWHNNDIKVSIIVPVYNSGKYLVECLNSIMCQVGTTYELIAIDDASTDDSVDILYEHFKGKENATIVKLNENHGQAYARNIGINTAKGKYIYFMDSDDYLLGVDAIMNLVNVAENRDTDCIIFDARKVYDFADNCSDLNNDILTIDIQEGSYSGKDFFSSLVEKDIFLVTVWRQFWKRETLIERELLFREDTSPHEDLIFWLEAMMDSSLFYYKKALYAYRVRNDSSSVKQYDKKRLMAHFGCLYYAKKKIDNTFISDDLWAAFDRWYEYLLRIIDGNCIDVIKNGEDINNLYAQDLDKRFEYKLFLLRKYAYLNRIFTPNEYNSILSATRVLIYGAGRAGRDVYNLLDEFGVNNSIYVVTKLKDECGNNIHQIDEFASEARDVVVVIGVTRKYEEEVMKNVKRLGFVNVISLNK